ncbi:hypothetical protein [Anatilimnocola floriformis]|uniref:hypothetical protein n=1 Tax=Anatilimnocola floriformis TaxID=2948575 RepID=UPI0020C4DC03|nr:hypothetical protein [Anatilimnocola floriformis]
MASVSHPKIDHVFALAFLYGTASFAHHVHNTIYLADYPNMPRWLTPLGVMVAWAFVASFGVIGGILVRNRLPTLGYLSLALFASLGFCGLDHYAIADISRHTFAMNATILIEVATGCTLLIAVLCRLPSVMRAEDLADAASQPN